MLFAKLKLQPKLNVNREHKHQPKFNANRKHKHQQKLNAFDVKHVCRSNLRLFKILAPACPHGTKQFLRQQITSPFGISSNIKTAGKILVPDLICGIDRFRSILDEGFVCNYFYLALQRQIKNAIRKINRQPN